MSFQFCSLASGSAGNASLVQVQQRFGRPTQVLVDCGLPYKHLLARMAERQAEIEDTNAIFITHEHSDHIGCAVQVSLTHRIPLVMSRGTFAAIGEPDLEGLLRVTTDGQVMAVDDLELKAFTVAHDAKEPLQLTLSDGAQSLGIVTDLGHATSYTASQLQGLDALILETNHDESLLRLGAYPPFLKERVGGAYGHLSNSQAAQLLSLVKHDKLKKVVLAHLSQQNNREELARAAIAQVWTCDAQALHVANQQQGTDWMRL